MTDGSMHYDKLEVRSEDERQRDIAKALPDLIAAAKAGARGYAGTLADVDPGEIRSAEDLARLPVLRKSEISQLQSADPPFGGLTTRPASEFDYFFVSPGPIHEPGRASSDWWRIARFLHVCGIGPGDLVQNCFSYHLTPAGLIFESGARAMGATVLPAGTGQTDLQAQIAARAGVTAYAGTPDYLKVILGRADELGLDLSRITKAGVSGGALFPTTRAYYRDRGISCLQIYATADAGSIAYETVPDEGLIVDEGVIVEIVTPGTGTPVEEGRIGEVLVTVLNHDYPLIRFATGDLSAFIPGLSSCGRTNRRLAGWKGRADQTTKIKGMFVRPEQVAELKTRCPEVERVRVVVTRQDEMDAMTVLVESDSARIAGIEDDIVSVLKLRGEVEFRPVGSLPNDGKVIDDQRSYD